VPRRTFTATANANQKKEYLKYRSDETLNKNIIVAIVVAVIVVIAIGVLATRNTEEPELFKVSMTQKPLTHDQRLAEYFDYYDVTVSKTTSQTLRDVDVWMSYGRDLELVRHYDYWGTGDICRDSALPLKGETPRVVIYWEGGSMEWEGVT